MTAPNGPNSFVQIDAPTTRGPKLATYEFPEGEECVESSAVTLTDSNGNELLDRRPAADSVPVVTAVTKSTFHNGHQTPVSATAVIVLPANPQRVTGVVQNVGDANIRVGIKGVTSTTGLRLVPNQSALFIEPDVYQGDIYAIREGGIDSIALGQEETTIVHAPPHLVCPPEQEH